MWAEKELCKDMPNVVYKIKYETCNLKPVKLMRSKITYQQKIEN